MDVARMLHVASKRDFGYFLFMEDDFVICPHGLRAIHYYINKADAYVPKWTMLRVGYGMNGMIVPREQVDVMQQHLVKAATRGRGVDLIAYDFHHKQGHIAAARHNLFEHAGVRSTYSDHNDRYAPKCYQLLYDWLQDHERFRFEDCPSDDLSPCPYSGLQSFDEDWGLSEERRPDKHRFLDWDAPEDSYCPLHFPICGDHVAPGEQARAQHCRHRKAL